MTSKHRHVAGLAAVLAFLGGCGGSSSDGISRLPNGDPNIGPAPRLVAPKRPKTVEDVAVDYATLPKLEPLAIGPGAKGPWFKKRSDGVYELHMPDNLLAQIMVGSSVFFAVPTDTSASASGDSYSPVSAGAQLCGGGLSTPTKAVWIGFSPKDKTPNAIEFVRYEGTFDPKTCSAKPTAAWHVRAPAILAGALYAFRSSKSTADQPAAVVPAGATKDSRAEAPAESPREEKLVIIGPRSIWVGSTAGTDAQRVPLAQPFARLVVPITPGSAASAMLDVAGEDLKAFQGSPGAALANAKVVSFSFDLVWPASDQLPTAVAFMSSLPGLPEQLVPAAQSGYDYQINLEE